MQLLPDATIAPSPSACARAMLEGIPPVMWFIRRHMRRHRTHGLSVPQYRTLVTLDGHQAATVSSVAENLGSSLPTTSRVVTGLVSKGLVRREALPGDRRQVALGLTPRGRTVLAAAQRETQDVVAHEVARLTDGQRGTITEAMELLRDVFAGTLPPADASENDLTK